MVRICRARIVGLVTRVAVRRSPGVDAIYVTTCTGDIDMCPGQWERGLAVIECCWLPCSGRVADLTIGRELSRGVIGIRCAVVILQVTGGACGADVKVSVYVAGVARNASVRTSEWKCRFAVIEGCWSPSVGGVADGTIRREIASLMIRVRRAVVVVHVARSAVSRSACIFAADVALRTLQICVHTSERETSVCSVIELGAGPTRSRMANAAVTREGRLRVIGIRRSVVILCVAPETTDGRSLREAAHVA